jgi:Ulp1 family protease
MKNWTKSRKKTIYVFEKKFLFIPINDDLHWSLCVVVNPGVVVRKSPKTKRKDAEDAEEWPW